MKYIESGLVGKAMIKVKKESANDNSLSDMSQSKYDFDLDYIKEKFNISQNSIDICLNKGNALKEIYDRYLKQKTDQII